MNLKKYLENHTSYIVNSNLGRFTYPTDMELELVGFSYDTSVDIQLSTGRVSPNGIYTKYFNQSIYGLLFVHSVRFSILDNQSWLNEELGKLYKVKRLMIPNKERFYELECRESNHLSPEYLLGLLMIPSIKDLVFSIKPRSNNDTLGEIVATIYDAKGKERVYKITDTSTMRSVYFEVQSNAPLKYLKQIGSIATNCTINIEDNGDVILDVLDERRKKSLQEYIPDIKQKYEQLKNYGGI